jgi:predicted Zn-dependent protease
VRQLAQDDDGLAFVVAHEMGHRVLRSRAAWRDARCGDACEEEADRLGLLYLEKAGFNPDHAPAVLLSLASNYRGLFDTRGRSMGTRSARLRALIEQQGSVGHEQTGNPEPARVLQNAPATIKKQQ